MATGLESDELKAIVLDQKKPALVLFSGTWCIDCRNFRPIWDAWTTGRTGPIYIVDTPRGGPEWEEWDIDEIPTVAAYSSGAEVGRAHGDIEEADLEKLWKMLKKK